jgi:hypothetical protein
MVKFSSYLTAGIVRKPYNNGKQQTYPKFHTMLRVIFRGYHMIFTNILSQNELINLKFIMG